MTSTCTSLAKLRLHVVIHFKQLFSQDRGFKDFTVFFFLFFFLAGKAKKEEIGKGDQVSLCTKPIHGYRISWISPPGLQVFFIVFILFVILLIYIHFTVFRVEFQTALFCLLCLCSPLLRLLLFLQLLFFKLIFAESSFCKSSEEKASFFII